MKPTTLDRHPLALGVLAWLLPGAGHYLLGERDKATLFSALIFATFVAGWAMGSFQGVFIGPGRYASLAQAPAGVVSLIAFVAAGCQGIKTVPLDRVYRLFSAGTLYTCVAGLLNALLVFDAVVRSYEKKLGKRIQR